LCGINKSNVINSEGNYISSCAMKVLLYTEGAVVVVW
jgi:hypothetical protein